MPSLGEGADEGIVSWHLKLGDEVAEGEWLADVSTSKVEMEISSPVTGVLIEICVSDDETAHVGDTLAVIGPPGSTPATAE